ncbi:MAG: hypothetical protein WC878_01420 [Candidatus Paceibacterota bacterium]|jgi:hypothetical protein
MIKLFLIIVIIYGIFRNTNPEKNAIPLKKERVREYYHWRNGERTGKITDIDGKTIG